MEINLYAGVKDGHIETGVSDGHGADVVLSVEETAAVNRVFSCVGGAVKSLHLERRSASYLSVVGPEYGDDFCRVKASPRALWISLDLFGKNVDDDPRLSSVKNKNQRHWKIPLHDVDDITGLADLIRVSLGSIGLAP